VSATGVGDRLRNLEGGDGARPSRRIHDRLGKARASRGRLREQAVGARIGAEVEVEGSVLLEENEDILDVPAEQIEFLIVTEIRRILHATRVAGDHHRLIFGAISTRCLWSASSSSLTFWARAVNGCTINAATIKKALLAFTHSALQKKIRDLTEEETAELELATDEALGRVEPPPK
jgi:hypothetical protein